MADFLQRFLGGAKATVSSAAYADPDFADFATAASPLPPSHAASFPSTAAAHTSSAPFGGNVGFFPSPFGNQNRPYTKWYRIWERVTIHDFYQEMVLIPMLLAVVIVNLIGTRMNVAKVRQWAGTYLPVLEGEFSQVGFERERNGKVSEDGLAELKQLKAKNEWFTYATGRQNVAWIDVKITLYKRFNPFLWGLESMLGFFFDTVTKPSEKMEATAYCFDGKEKAMAPQASGASNSAFDGFVWAVVHKDKMQRLRDDRYDLSLTSTRDHPKLPEWATVMSESAEITDALLTPELLQAINDTGEDLEALLVSDQPIDAPKKLNDLVPRKRVSLSLKLTPSTLTTPSKIFTYFLRLPDSLTSSARFRPEAMRKIRATREEEMRKLRKIDDDEKAEERKTASDKLRKEERERKVRGLSAEEQRKFLEREADADRKKGMKKRSMRG